MKQCCVIRIKFYNVKISKAVLLMILNLAILFAPSELLYKCNGSVCFQMTVIDQVSSVV